MAYQRTDGDLNFLSQPACMHLRSKAMYVTGQLVPTDPDEEDSHTQNCWCNLTQHVLGPDDTPVNLIECAPNRRCFVMPRA